MRTMTATEASRNFSDLLDLVGSGETVRITRGSELVAEIGPARRRTGASLEDALHAASLPPLDDDFERDVASAVGLVANDGDGSWPGA